MKQSPADVEDAQLGDHPVRARERRRRQRQPATSLGSPSLVDVALQHHHAGARRRRDPSRRPCPSPCRGRPSWRGRRCRRPASRPGSPGRRGRRGSSRTTAPSRTCCRPGSTVTVCLPALIRRGVDLVLERERAHAEQAVLRVQRHAGRRAGCSWRPRSACRCRGSRSCPGSISAAARRTICRATSSCALASTSAPTSVRVVRCSMTSRARAPRRCAARRCRAGGRRRDRCAPAVDQLVDLGDGHVGGRGHHRVEVARGPVEAQVAERCRRRRRARSRSRRAAAARARTSCRRSRAPPCPRRPPCRRRSACRSRRCRRRRRGCARRACPAASARPPPVPACTARRGRGCRRRSCRSPARPAGSCSSTASPLPWLPQLLLMMVRFLTPLRAIAVDAGLGVAAQAEAARHDRHAVAQQAGQRLSTFGKTLSIGGDVQLTPAPRRTPRPTAATASSSSASRDHQRRGEVDQVVALVHVQVMSARAPPRPWPWYPRAAGRVPGAHELERPQQAEAADLADVRARRARSPRSVAPRRAPAAAARSTSPSSR